LQFCRQRHKGKARTQLQQKIGDVLDQGALDITLMRIRSQAEKIKAIRIFEGLARQIGLRLGQMALKIAHAIAAALQQAGLNLDDQHIARPVVLDCLGGIPAAGFGTGEFVQQD